MTDEGHSRYERLARLARSLTGQVWDARKVFLLETRLKPVMDMLGAASVDEFLARMDTDIPSNLKSYLADAFTDGETWFFRERAAIDTLAASVAEKVRSKGQDGPVSVWCAGGATGQEAVSLAIRLDEIMPEDTPDRAVRIVTSDIGYRATTRARSAVYSHFEIQRGLSAARMLTHFERSDERTWQLKPRMREKVDPRQHNLLDGPLSESAFDFVLCRNVLSGMAADALARIAEHLKTALRQGGVLLTAVGEGLPRSTGFAADPGTGAGFFRPVS